MGWGEGGGATPDPACECGASVETIDHMSNQTPHAKNILVMSEGSLVGLHSVKKSDLEFLWEFLTRHLNWDG